MLQVVRWIKILIDYNTVCMAGGLAYRGVYTIETMEQMHHGKNRGRFFQALSKLRGEISLLIVALVAPRSWGIDAPAWIGQSWHILQVWAAEAGLDDTRDLPGLTYEVSELKCVVLGWMTEVTLWVTHRALLSAMMWKPSRTTLTQQKTAEMRRLEMMSPNMRIQNELTAATWGGYVIAAHTVLYQNQARWVALENFRQTIISSDSKYIGRWKPHRCKANRFWLTNTARCNGRTVKWEKIEVFSLITRNISDCDQSNYSSRIKHMHSHIPIKLLS